MKRKPPIEPERVETAQELGRAEVSSGARGRSLVARLERVEAENPALLEAYDMSPAAVRAGAMVRSMRKKASLTQKQLAEVLGVTQERISNIERGVGKQGPTFDVMNTIAMACQHQITATPLDNLEVAAAADTVEVSDF